MTNSNIVRIAGSTCQPITDHDLEAHDALYITAEKIPGISLYVSDVNDILHELHKMGWLLIQHGRPEVDDADA